MSETDGFIDEVTEEVRRDRLFGFFRRYGWMIGLAIAIIVGGAAFNEYRKATREANAQRLGEAVLTAMALPNAEARADALAEISAGNNSAANAILVLVQSAADVQNQDVRSADAKLASIATDANTPDIYRDLARLKRLFLNGNPMSDADRLATIDALSAPGSPFRTLAEEQRALMLIQQGDDEGALAIFQALLSDSEATQQLQTRARQMIVVLGGSLDAG